MFVCVYVSTVNQPVNEMDEFSMNVDECTESFGRSVSIVDWSYEYKG